MKLSYLVEVNLDERSEHEKLLFAFLLVFLDWNMINVVSSMGSIFDNFDPISYSIYPWIYLFFHLIITIFVFISLEHSIYSLDSDAFFSFIFCTFYSPFNVAIINIQLSWTIVQHCQLVMVNGRQLYHSWETSYSWIPLIQDNCQEWKNIYVKMMVALILGGKRLMN